MTPERLAEIRERAARDYAAHESGIYLSNELVADRMYLLAEVDSLSSELRLADAHAGDADASLADHKAEVDRLREQLLNLNRWVERVNAKRITEAAIERGARALHAQRYGWGDFEEWSDPEVQKVYHEEAEACLRAALASGDA